MKQCILWWIELINKFRNIKLDEFIIMPNHMHGIIFINIVGATPCGRPDLMDRQYQNTGQPRRVAPTMGDIMDWFKTMTTNDYISCVKKYDWPRFNSKLWQRNYYEHIIRNETELNKTREYIINNPLHWETDKNYRGN
jgi:putative transposase